MNSRQTGSRRSAFTLVEMLTVIAIITLLIGILVPSLSAARDQARKAAVKAQMNAITAGCEMFRNDEGEYPRSNAYQFGPYGQPAAQDTQALNWEVVSGAIPLQGAHLIVDAMVGRDFLGYDNKPGTGAGATVASRWYAGAVAAGSFPRPRRNPYIRTEGIQTANDAKPPEDGYGTLPNLNEVLPQPDNADPKATCFVDKFKFPILYYRSNPRATNSSPILQSPVGTPIDARVGDGFYDGRDNKYFVNPAGRPAQYQHRINDADVASYDPTIDVGQVSLSNRFAEFIRSLRGTTYQSASPTLIEFPRPVNTESFVLLSPGKDGIYGTLDDVGNYDVLSEER
ncbi:MAG: type II secretion system protein [Phycisphaerae bacterium]